MAPFPQRKCHPASSQGGLVSVAVYVGEHVAASGVVPLPLRDNITPATWLSPLFDGCLLYTSDAADE